MADDDARKWLGCLGWGCLAVVVISALGIGGCVAFVYQGGKGAHTVAEAYLEAVEAGRYEDAFAALGPGFGETYDLAEFVAFEQAARSETGPCEEWKTRGTSFNREQGMSTSQLRFVGSCDGGPVTVAFRLEEIDGVWVIQDIRYNEASVDPEPVVELCAGCSGVIPPGARFCPSCGADLSDGEAAAPEATGSAAPP